ncbi:MAG TPA: DUF499 domain-containing protein, partial [Candidatus Entotheonella sp.]
MKTLRQLCVPRQSVFDRNRRDVVLDLTDLIDDRITASAFFEENYLTDGMKRLLREAFGRFEGTSEQGVLVLTQAMGGGKTHNMIALGLLAKHPELRRQVMGEFDEAHDALGPVRVVAFSGRESDAPLGIWGSIAEQLGKKAAFKDYYSPLSAPGQTAWVNLLQGEPLLILLDELPPYFENARAKPIGNSDLSVVTTTALSNLLVAVGKPALANVCVVISDLKATYEGGSARLNRALEDFENEAGRSALTLEPVGLNTDEIYHILRKRLFDTLPSAAEVEGVAQAYAQAVRDAKQMDITSASPEKFAQLLKASYPFHFAIRDLYARFRENPGFQQTRGLIRFMRVVVSRLFEDRGPADRLSLIHAHDLDLNDRETKAQLTHINPTLDNAISHDIASNGQAIAEIMDARLGGTDAQDACKLLLVASLSSVPDAVLGLSLSEVASFLCAPGRDLSMLRKDILAELNTRAWYLHANRDGKLYFKNVQNLVAKLKTTAEAYNRESSRQELRRFLEKAFAPSLKDCYQEVLVLPPVDEIVITPDRVSLIVCEPPPGGGLHPDLQRFYADLTYPNRILFLSGARGSLETLLETAAELKAIDFILDEMDIEWVPERDPQRAAATDMRDKIIFRLLSAARETFTTLTYPHGDQLMHADFQMQFTDNHYNGEKQIRETLKAKQKFTEEVASETFRKKCEQRLFTQKAMPWSEVKKRAATNPLWQWHRMEALDKLKNDLVRKDQWREQGNYVEKPPFPKPHTDVRVQELQRDDRTGTAVLKLTPVHGDTLYYEVDDEATPASAIVPDPRHFETRDLTVSFLCVDSKGEHDTGEPVVWQNRITIQSRVYQSGNEKMVELRATPAAPLRYTTDGSNPNLGGTVYEGPFAVPKNAYIVLASAETAGLVAEHRLDLDAASSDAVKIDPERPAIWKHKHQS